MLHQKGAMDMYDDDDDKKIDQDDAAEPVIPDEAIQPEKGEDTPDDQEEEMQQPESPIPMNPAGPARKRQGKTLRKKKMLPMEPALRIPWNISTPY